jgi:RNA polymerase sigma-70 factor (ECF subfamily)
MAAPAREEGSAGPATGPEAELVELVDRCRRGDVEAFERLYRCCSGSVYGLCLRLCGDAQEAEARTQDAFVRAWQKLASYDGRGSFRGWLRRLTVHVVYDQRRRQKRRRRLVEPFPEALAEDADPEAILGARTDAPRHLEAIDLERAVAHLPEGARMVFVLHDVEGYRHQDIAAMLSITTGTSKAQLHRARRLLRVMLGHEAR